MFLRKIISYYFICIFLISSVILPLGDLSLMNDLPGMYANYKKLANPKETGITDFIGDYLLAGKMLLGHNKKDKPETSSNTVQFQHSPASLSLFYNWLQTPTLLIKDLKISYLPLKNFGKIAGFHPELFRPPLA